MLWIALAIIYVVWGSTYFAIALVVQTMPPLLTAGVRFLARDQAGFWEEGGYHMRGVPWGPGDGERFRWS